MRVKQAVHNVSTQRVAFGAGPGPLAGRVHDGLPRTEPFGQVTPLNAGPHPVQNPVDHLPLIPPPAATTVAEWQERPKLFPFGIRQVTPPHDHVNGSATEWSQ
jgi:hypothetical protein